jgi:hypothetical protein
MNEMEKTARRVLKFFASLKLAVLVVVGLTIALIVATILESKFDTPTSQFWVYRARWFYGLLGFLGLNIFGVMVDRWPWKWRHGPFLMAHVGILLLLFGSFLTFRLGVDGIMEIREGTRSSEVRLDEQVLVIQGGGAEGAHSQSSLQVIPIPWRPPHVGFTPIELPEHGLRITQFLPHAEPKVEFRKKEETDGKLTPAIRVRVASDPATKLPVPPVMRMGQEVWLWVGDPGWTSQQVGGATLSLSVAGQPARRELPPAVQNEGSLVSLDLVYDAQAQSVRARSGKNYDRIVKPESGLVLVPGWKNDIQITVLEWISDAESLVRYEPSLIQYGTQAPPSAIELQVDPPLGAKIWLGLEERAGLERQGKNLRLGYYYRRLNVPFQIGLEKFQIDRYPGSDSPMEFSSVVHVYDKQQTPLLENHPISMNQPLQHGGYTFYQASYRDEKPRPVTSVFSVNRDPGRLAKYWGSLFLVLGSLWLFQTKLREQRKRAKLTRMEVQVGLGEDQL